MNLGKRKMASIILVLLMVLTICFTHTGVVKTAKAAGDDVALKLEANNTWSDGTANYLQVNGVITNDTNQEVTDWKVTIPVQTSASISQGWSGTYMVKDEVLTITPDTSNKIIRANSEVSFGFIMKNPGVFNASEAKLVYKGVVVQPTPADTNHCVRTPPITLIPVSEKPSPTPTTTITTPPVSKEPSPTPTPTKDTGKKDWLYTNGSRVYDEDGKEVWMTGVNWFGYNTGTNVFDGVWDSSLDGTIKELANRGFNLMRVPISSEVLLNWKAGVYPKPNINYEKNKDLVGLNSLEVFDHVLAECKKNGIKIMMDIHCATNAVAHYYPVWFTPDCPEEDYLESLRWMSNRYKDDDTIVAVDLKNEPHGAAGASIRAIWNDSTDQYNWKYVATKAANTVLKENPNLLIVVEGIEIYPIDTKNNSDFHSTNGKDYYGCWWGGNLRGVKDYPIDLGIHQNKLVYSPHDYGPSVSDQPWFHGDYTMESLYNDCWHDNWFYIQEEKIAPLLIGEWGGFMTQPTLSWMTDLRDFIIKNHINHTFWCYNFNSGDTGGLVQSDFTTWDEEKYEFVKPALWQKDGKFVSLDHDTPLGENGISLSEY